MTVHLIKLAAGGESVAGLQAWQDHVASERRRAGGPLRPVHVTRMAPKRADELLNGGSLYWVIKGVISARQRILGLDAVTGADGISRCAIDLDRELIVTDPAPRKAFQGWRYLKAEDAPGDARLGAGGTRLPEPLRRELLNLGVW